MEPDLDSCLAFVCLEWTPLKANMLAVSRDVCGGVVLFVCFCDSHVSLSLVRPIVSVMRLALKSDQQ